MVSTSLSPLFGPFSAQHPEGSLLQTSHFALRLKCELGFMTCQALRDLVPGHFCNSSLSNFSLTIRQPQ